MNHLEAKRFTHDLITRNRLEGSALLLTKSAAGIWIASSLIWPERKHQAQESLVEECARCDWGADAVVTFDSERSVVAVVSGDRLAMIDTMSASVCDMLKAKK